MILMLVKADLTCTFWRTLNTDVVFWQLICKIWYSKNTCKIFLKSITISISILHYSYQKFYFGSITGSNPSNIKSQQQSVGKSFFKYHAKKLEKFLVYISEYHTTRSFWNLSRGYILTILYRMLVFNEIYYNSEMKKNWLIIGTWVIILWHIL